MQRIILKSLAILAAAVGVACVMGSTPAGAQPATTKPATTSPASQPGEPLTPPVVNADGTVTFSVVAPDAEMVEVWGDWPKPYGLRFVPGQDGVWALTSKLPRGLWSFNYKIYPKPQTGPAGPTTRPATMSRSVELDLPDNLPWDARPDIPHGKVTIQDYTSKYRNQPLRLRVYTPPGYDNDKTQTYPVLYLLHGSGQNDHHWIDAGRANVILDNFIADGKAVPMIVVTPNSGSPKFSDELLGEIMPMIEAGYRTKNDPDARAVAGLSRGGQQSLDIGLHHPELFRWVGGISSPVQNPERDFEAVLHPAAATPLPFKLIWLMCGEDDSRFFSQNAHFDQVLTGWNVAHTFTPVPGKHFWPVWRAGLVALAPQLFR